MFIEILSKVGVIFLVMAAGALARRNNILDDAATRALARVVLVVALPLLYFHSLATEFTFGLLKTIWILPIFAFIMVLTGYGLSRLLSRLVHLDKPAKATFIYLATFTNCGFLAIPIASALYGPEGIVRIVFFNVGFNLLYWTLGVWTLRTGSIRQDQGMPSPFKNLLNSGTIGLLCGITAGLVSIKLPGFLMDSAGLLGSATIPLALLVVGSIMVTGDMRKVRAYKRPVILIILCRLIVIPSFVYFVTGWFSFLTPLARSIIVLQSAMPSASTTPIFTSRFGGDSQLASVGVFATHICSIITVPFFISLL